MICTGPTGPTIDLITAVARRRRPASLLVVGTYRHTDLDDGHPLSTTVSELAVRGLAAHIRLAPLSLETATELVTRRQADPPPPEAMKALHRRSGGNPLFLGALLDTTAERGPDTDLPRSLREMVEHHLDQLQPADRDLIEAAAVAGIDFDVQLLGSSQHVDEVWQRCHALARRDRLIAVDDRGRQGYFHFRHSLYQEVTYAGVLHPRRRALHQLVGERLESTADDVTSSAAELAEHFSRSGMDRERCAIGSWPPRWPPFATHPLRLSSTFAQDWRCCRSCQTVKSANARRLTYSPAP
jgi:predicted ATPase